MHGHWLKNVLGGGSGSGSGSGSGGGSAEPFVVRLLGNKLTADKTFQEIADAFDAGEMIRVFGVSDDSADPAFAFIAFCEAAPEASYCSLIYWDATKKAFAALSSANGVHPDEEDPTDYPYFATIAG